jgi:sulfate/thiosulfate-binding protein
MELFSKRQITGLVSLGATAAFVFGLSACGGDDSDSGSTSADGTASGSVNLVAYSTPQEVYEGVLQPAFQDGDGGEVEFASSFASSGDQSRAVEAGQPADLVHLALEPDMTRLVDAGLIPEDWADNEYGGVLQESVVAFTVREGNPENIQDWDDLLRDDVEVITPNPFTSGGARWNIMAAYGQVLENGGTEEEALQFVADMLENTAVQDASASDALETFTSGEGDVLISYENEAIRAQNAGEDVDYVIPDDTIRIETVAAIPVESSNPEAAQSFLDFLLSDEGQTLWAENGYRPVDPKVLAKFENELPPVEGLFDIDEFGGWDTVMTEFFDPENGSVAEIERELGVTTG